MINSSDRGRPIVTSRVRRLQMMFIDLIWRTSYRDHRAIWMIVTVLALKAIVDLLPPSLLHRHLLLRRSRLNPFPLAITIPVISSLACIPWWSHRFHPLPQRAYPCLRSLDVTFGEDLRQRWGGCSDDHANRQIKTSELGQENGTTRCGNVIRSLRELW